MAPDAKTVDMIASKVGRIGKRDVTTIKITCERSFFANKGCGIDSYLVAMVPAIDRG